MFDKNICIIDFETTGNLERIEPTRITEIGLIKLDKNLNKIDKFQTYVNPEENLTEFIVNYTGLTDDLLKDKPIFKDIANELTNFIDGKNSTIAAWPTSFELPILQYEYANANIDFPLERRAIDIGSLAAFYIYKNKIELKKHPKSKFNYFSLDNISYTFGIEIKGNRHSALADAELESDVLIYILKNWN